MLKVVVVEVLEKLWMRVWKDKIVVVERACQEELKGEKIMNGMKCHKNLAGSQGGSKGTIKDHY